MEARQIWHHARPTTVSAPHPHCTPFTLPSNGVLSLGPSELVTLTTDAVFQPECTGSNSIILTSPGSSSISNLRDPFYASTLPQCYALAAATVLAYMLFIMLLITPRTFLLEGAVVLGRRGFTNGPSGSDAGIGIGGRPWLQKVAALTVAVSLSIATSDTFKVAHRQYDLGVMDALSLQQEVENGMELRVIRVISDTFLWLAQAQTLIRLFPRQREKIIIKWTAFALITLDVVFSLLNNFVFSRDSRPRVFVNAIPALSYLFQLSLSLLYCAWVMWYSITKRRFAFYHPQMKNVCLVALLSLVSILVPVVFFVLDISKPDLAAWGDYVRWVGAAAASVVVWEWVERIEALERNDKKDGVLGREVFDGDEMLDITPSSDLLWAQRARKRRGGRGGGGAGTGSSGGLWPAITSRHRSDAAQDVETGEARPNGSPHNRGRKAIQVVTPLWPKRPPTAATPVSRTDTASAESTVYAVRYHPISEATPPNTRRCHNPPQSQSNSNSTEVSKSQGGSAEYKAEPGNATDLEQMTEEQNEPATRHTYIPWRTLSSLNPFRRQIQKPPPEVSAHTARIRQSTSGHGSSHRWDVRARIEDFATTRVDKMRDKARPNPAGRPLPVTVIPAPTRRRDLAKALEEIEEAENSGRAPNMAGVRLSDTAETTDPNRNEIPDESSRPCQAPRPGNPYTPADLHRHSITQRGAVSFVTATPGRRDRDGDATSIHEEPRGRSPISSRSRASRTRESVAQEPSLPAPTPQSRPSAGED